MRNAPSSPALSVNMVAQSDVVVVLVYVLVGILAFAVTFLLLQEKSAAYISHISDAIERISDGDLNTQVEVVGMTSFLPWLPT
ncbi:MAG: hypothetical protein ACLUD2_09145 [Clostridium sp.]